MLTDIAGARPALAGQPPALGRPCRGRDQRPRRAATSSSASVIRQADSLMRILTTVLEISRSEALTGRSQFSLVRRRRARRRAYAKCTSRWPRKPGPRSASDRPEHPMPLFGHRQLLAQAVSNLIENAIRYGAAGRRDPTSRVEPTASGIRDRRRRPRAGHSGRAPRGSACGASAGSIRAARRKAPGWASRWPGRSPTSTAAN